MNSSRTAQATAGQMTTGSVTSTDGTPIGYLRAGRAAQTTACTPR